MPHFPNGPSSLRVVLDANDPALLSSSIGSVHDPLDEVLFHDLDTEYKRPATLLAVEESGYKVELLGGVRMFVRSAEETPEWCKAVREALAASGESPDSLNIAGYLVDDRWLPLSDPEGWWARWARARAECQAKSVIDS